MCKVWTSLYVTNDPNCISCVDDISCILKALHGVILDVANDIKTLSCLATRRWQYGILNVNVDKILSRCSGFQICDFKMNQGENIWFARITWFLR